MDLLLLEESVKQRLSEKRFLHTIGVCKMAERLGMIFLPDRCMELISAAYLHDIAKELPEEMLKALIEEYGYTLTESDNFSPQVFHSFAAPAVIIKDFPTLATKDILSAVFNHTLGTDRMSLFDEIIFLSDFIEQGRRYDASVEVRNKLFSDLSLAKNYTDKLLALHRATLASIDSTISTLKKRNLHINEKTKNARQYFLNLIKQENKNEH